MIPLEIIMCRKTILTWIRVGFCFENWNPPTAEKSVSGEPLRIADQ